MSETTKTLTLTLDKHTARFVLEALRELESKWVQINRTSLDEDEQADCGMDALDLHGTRESIEEQAIAVFGSGVLNFSRRPIIDAPPAKGR